MKSTLLTILRHSSIKIICFRNVNRDSRFKDKTRTKDLEAAVKVEETTKD